MDATTQRLVRTGEGRGPIGLQIGQLAELLRFHHKLLPNSFQAFVSQFHFEYEDKTLLDLG